MEQEGITNNLTISNCETKKGVFMGIIKEILVHPKQTKKIKMQLQNVV